MDVAGVELVDLFALGAADTVTVADLTQTDVLRVNVDIGGADGAADNLFVDGRTVADNALITAAAGTVSVTGLRYDVKATGTEAAADRLTFRANDGDDTVKAAAGVEGTILITLDGGFGDDYLSADAILIGGPGSDFLEGGAGADQLFGNEGEDTMIGRGGADTFDGGPDFDTILIEGTSGPDVIDVRQTNATTLVHTVNGDVQTDTMVAGTVEQALVEAGAGADVMRVAIDDGLFDDPGMSLRMTVFGGLDNAMDRLGIVDDGVDDLTLYRKGELDSTGTVAIGPGNAEPFEHVFEQVERVQFVDEAGNPLNDPTSPTSPSARLVVFKHDPFEFNDDRFIATHLGANQTINVDPTIDPGLDPDFGFPADLDWYRVEAEVSGTLDLQVFFEELPTLGSGRPGLPGDGNLDIFLYDVDGTLIAGAGPDFGGNNGGGLNPELNVDGDAFAENERIRIPAVQGQVYYLRVGGAATAINNYTITVINTPAPKPFDLELDDAVIDGVAPDGSDTGRNNTDNITRDNTPTIYFRLDDAFFLQDLPGNSTADTPPDEVIPIPFRAGPAQPVLAGYAIAIFDEGDTPGKPAESPQVPLGFATATADPGVYVFTTPVLADGSHFLTARVQMIDPAAPQQTGFGPRSLSLEIVVDTIEPPISFGLPTAPDDGLVPDSDSGVSPPNQDTIVDNVTNDTTPAFWGQAEADTIVRLYADVNDNNTLEIGTDVFLGQGTAIPLDGNLQEPDGYWTIQTIVDLNDPNHFPVPDGVRTIFVTAEDVAGNVNPTVGPVTLLDIFIDTQGPVIDAVYITDNPATAENESLYDLFDPKPSTDGPTPLVFSLTIEFTDPPPRVAPFLYNALKQDVAEEAGHYRVVGDANGVIPIQDVIVTQTIDAGGIAHATVTLVFLDLGADGLPFTADDVGAPLPDDRFTLTITDDIVDPAGNRLDGENNAVEPHEAPIFPTGDGVPGGDFVARFTVDSRPEVGAWAAGTTWIDTNGNGHFDPENLDYTNRDIVYTLGYTTDTIFAGNFSGPGADGVFGTSDDTTAPAGNALADGFDKLALYGKVGSTFRWLADTDNDGVIVPPAAGPDVYRVEPTKSFGLPFAGRFGDSDADPTRDLNGDEVGYQYSTPAMHNKPIKSIWRFDTNHDFRVDYTLNSQLKGYPVVGDFDGDGFDDLGTWTSEPTGDWFYLDLANGTLRGWNGLYDYRFRFGFIGVRERPAAADIDGDGYDDLGLWVADRSGSVPQEECEWYFLVSHGKPLGERIHSDPTTGQNVIDFTPKPFGFDEYIRFGDDFAVPVIGNFDPPVTPGSPGPINLPVEVTSLGTPGNDAIEFIAGAGASQWTVKINGVAQSVDPKAGAIILDGMDGKDTVKITGTSDIDELDLADSGIVFSGSGFFVRLNNVEQITVDGRAGDDIYQISDLSAKTTIVDNKGTDLLDFSDAVVAVNVNLASASAQRIFGPGNANTLTLRGRVENVIGSPQDDFIRGNSAANWIEGRDGNDRIYGGAGNDTIFGGLGDDWLYGEAGNDSLFGELGNNMLLGGDGNDLLDVDASVGLVATGRNLLIGGKGQDTLRGGAGQEILVGDTTTYDARTAALAAIMQEWTPDNDFLTRQARLTEGLVDSGNARSKLRLARKTRSNPSGTVLDESAADQLFGGPGDDWFFSFGNDRPKDG
jgi:Ca2+-binding RTX toxin-like protein